VVSYSFVDITAQVRSGRVSAPERRQPGALGLRRGLRRRAPTQLPPHHDPPAPAPTGRSVQVEPMKYILTAPGIKRLKLKHGVPLSKFAFKFDLRRYNPRAVLIGGQTNDQDNATALAGGGVYELCLDTGEWTRHATEGWPQPSAGLMVGCKLRSITGGANGVGARRSRMTIVE